MKTFIAIGFLVSALQASALTLAPGETTKIHDTDVTCQSNTGNRCSIVKDNCYDGVRVTVDSKAVTICLRMSDALAEVQKIKSSGICQ